MNGLRTGRVVVIDDDPVDSAALMSALSTLGIAATFFSGDKDRLPASKLKGVRLVALDLNLSGFGGKEAKETIGHALSVLRSIVDDDNGPFVVLAWTSSGDEEIKELVRQLPDAHPSARPPFVVPLKKADVKDSNGFNHRTIVSRIAEVSSEWSPLDVLMFWEQLVHDSASATIETLKSLARQDSLPAWKSQLAFALRSLAEATLGQEAADTNSFISALSSTLSAVHQDRCEHAVSEVSLEVSKSATAIQAATGDKNAIRGELNRILLTAPIQPSDTTVRSGNLYVQSDKSRVPMADYPADTSAWVKGLFGNVSVKPAAQKELDDLNLLDKASSLEKGMKLKREGLIKNRDDMAANLAKILKSALRAQVEVTPVCDYAQQKQGPPRIMPGLLIPTDLARNFKKDAEYLWTSRTLKLGLENSKDFGVLDYVIALDARYITSTPLEAFK
jgi:CheY-like chemotaxis protein